MAYIYKIVNDINQKIYIGKTEFSIEKRFKEHCQDAFRDRNEKRPLYAAMRKYGIEHFHIEQIEETNNPEEREKYWIEHYRSFKNGYNATLGGDGKRYLDYDVLIFAYKENPNLEEISQIYHCDRNYLSQILKKYNIEIKSQEKINQEKFGYIINQYDKNGKYLRTFPSLSEAYKTVRPESTSRSGISHISDVCKGKRKTAYGYIWKFSK